MYGMMAKSKWLMAVQLLMAGTMIGCGADQGTGPNPGPAPVASVRVEPKEGVWTGSLRVGQTVQLRARPLAADGNELPAGPTLWSSRDPSVASVSTTGVVKGLGQSISQTLITELAGALFGRYVMAKRFGSARWRQISMVLLAGYGCGSGLVMMFAVGVKFLSAAVFQLPY